MCASTWACPSLLLDCYWRSLIREHQPVIESRLRGHFERLEGLLEKLTQNHASLISQTIEPHDCFRRRLHVELLIPPCRMSPNSGPRRLVSQSSRLPTRKAVFLGDALDLLWLNAA